MNIMLFPLLMLTLIGCNTIANKAELSSLNNEINNLIIYKREPIDLDHWQSPIETLKKGTGDCEDIAILKLSKLSPKDYPSSNLVIVWSYSRMEYHVIVRVTDTSGNILYLDNLNTHLLTTLEVHNLYDIRMVLPSYRLTKS